MVNVIVQISCVIVGILYMAGTIQYVGDRRFLLGQKTILTPALIYAAQEQERLEKKRQMEYEEEERIKTCPFCMDVLIRHGSAFGGFAALLPDGRRRKGIVRLDTIMLYGRPLGANEVTYYIEEQGIEICATESPNELLVRSNGRPFGIRDEGMNRDQGISCTYARIQRDVLYYIMLESKHEISIKATKAC